MKQRRFGRKVQNWHRPLGRGQLGQRFLRKRNEDPDPVTDAELQFCEVDQCWDWLDSDDGWFPPYWQIRDPDTDRDISEYSLRLFLSNVWKSPELVLPETSNASAPTSQDAPRERVSDSRTPLEERLAEYIERIAQFSDYSQLLRTQVAESLGDLQSVNTLKVHIQSLQGAGLFERLCLFSPFWVRRPRAWTGRETVDLLNHLFVLHPVPAFLYQEWFREHDFPRFKWLSWFILLAQGGSLKRAATVFAQKDVLRPQRYDPNDHEYWRPRAPIVSYLWSIPNRFSHHLQCAPADIKPIAACIWAEIRRLGGSDREFHRVLRHPGFAVDPTEIPESELYPTFWFETVRWIIAHGDQITDDECNEILNWALHQYTESERGDRSPFSWKSRRLRATLQRSAEYRELLEDSYQPVDNFTWRSHGWDWTLQENETSSWSFVELQSGSELNEEGYAMHHCVAGYAGRCAAGYSAIVSLRHNEKRRVTIELAPKTGRVRQAKGPQNSDPRDGEAEVIAKWLDEVVRPSRLPSATKDADTSE